MRLNVELVDEDLTVHVAEVVGVSRQCPCDAVWRAVSGVLNPARHVVGLDLPDRTTVNREDGAEFRVTVKIAYTCDPDAPLIEPAVTSDILGVTGDESVCERHLVPAGG